MDSRAKIIKIQAGGINGPFGYEIDYSEDSFSQNLSIIFGDNGTGKTTLLNAIYNVLTPGRRSLKNLIHLEVDNISISLSNGASISYVRNWESPEASVLTIEHPSLRSESESEPDAAEASGSPAISTRLEDWETSGASFTQSSQTRMFMEFHRRLTIPVIFVADDRSVSEGGRQWRRRIGRDRSNYLAGERRDSTERGEVLQRMRTQELEDAVDEATRYLSGLAISGVSDGSRSAESFYADLIRHIYSERASAETALTAEEAKAAVVAKIHDVENRAAKFTEYRLVDIEQVKAIEEAFKEAPRSNARSYKTVHTVVMPYLDSLLKRMESLEPARDAIDAYVTSINKFINRKTFKFNVVDGYELELDQGDSRGDRELVLGGLSSGEKHLIMLLSYAIYVRSTGGILMIDEPELSLGLKWRRALVPALLRCAGLSPEADVNSDSNLAPQFLLASHAVEILAEYDEVLVRPYEGTSSEARTNE